VIFAKRLDHRFRAGATTKVWHRPIAGAGSRFGDRLPVHGRESRNRAIRSSPSGFRFATAKEKLNESAEFVIAERCVVDCRVACRLARWVRSGISAPARGGPGGYVGADHAFDGPVDAVSADLRPQRRLDVGSIPDRGGITVTDSSPSSTTRVDGKSVAISTEFFGNSLAFEGTLNDADTVIDGSFTTRILLGSILITIDNGPGTLTKQ
jgi:hypothetical protein